MGELKLYRKRIIPQECILLEDDILLYRDNEVIITKWNTIRPKKTLSHGYSCYFLERGFKVSKFYDHDDQLISWYCDIIDTAYSCEDGTETYIFTDLLADVVVYPDGRVRVVDLDELADAQRDHLIQPEELQADDVLVYARTTNYGTRKYPDYERTVEWHRLTQEDLDTRRTRSGFVWKGRYKGDGSRIYDSEVLAVVR